MIEFFDQEFIIFYDLQLGRFYKKIPIDWVLNIEIPKFFVIPNFCDRKYISFDVKFLCTQK